MILAIEDVLSEAVARKMVASFRADVEVSTVIGRRGNTYLQGKARELNRTARTQPVMLIIDLDSPQNCPPALIAEWLGAQPQPHLLFRIAVMEVESWVLADRERIAAALAIPEHRVPLHTDSIGDPKQFLINLARRSRIRDVREDLVPAPWLDGEGWACIQFAAHSFCGEDVESGSSRTIVNQSCARYRTVEVGVLKPTAQLDATADAPAAWLAASAPRALRLDGSIREAPGTGRTF